MNTLAVLAALITMLGFTVFAFGTLGSEWLGWAFMILSVLFFLLLVDTALEDAEEEASGAGFRRHFRKGKR